MPDFPGQPCRKRGEERRIRTPLPVYRVTTTVVPTLTRPNKSEMS